MESRHHLYFNHDEDAPGYDADVQNEANPIRSGYAALQHWIGAVVPPGLDLADLGCGTGNTILSLEGWKSLVGVDVSEKMLTLARGKLAGRADLSFCKQDLLTFLDTYTSHLDGIVSVYALHHLEQDEKHTLFQLAAEKKTRILAFGDLMFANRSGKKEMYAEYPHLREDFDAEYFWDVEEETLVLEELGYTVTTRRFSDLSWGMRACLEPYHRG